MKNHNIHFYNEIADLLIPFKESLGKFKQQKIKLIIHVGTPKTGTTSIQTYLGKKQSKLRGKGILYPHNHDNLQHPTAPKHQWFEKNLVTTHLDYFLENFKNIISQVTKDTHTIILSSEGIYNYWWGFPDASKEILSALGDLFDVDVWVWFCESVKFIERYYKQCIRNPKVESNPCYGRDLSFSEMLNIEWFSKHLDYQGFVSECQLLFGKDNVSVFEYKGDVVQEVIHKLGLATRDDNPTPRKNRTLNNASIKLLRSINQYDIKAKDKERLMPYIKEIDKIMNGYVNDTLVDDESRKKILKMSSPIIF